MAQTPLTAAEVVKQGQGIDGIKLTALIPTDAAIDTAVDADTTIVGAAAKAAAKVERKAKTAEQRKSTSAGHIYVAPPEVTFDTVPVYDISEIQAGIGRGKVTKKVAGASLGFKNVNPGSGTPRA